MFGRLQKRKKQKRSKKRKIRRRSQNKSVYKTTFNWLDKILDYRYIYLMKIRGKKEYKIGISFNPLGRKNDIDEEVKGRLIILKTVRTIFAEKKEQKLHRIFHRKN